MRRKRSPTDAKHAKYKPGNTWLVRSVPIELREKFKRQCGATGFKMNSVIIAVMEYLTQDDSGERIKTFMD